MSFIPGMFPRVAGRPQLTSLSLFTSANAPFDFNSSPLSIPATVQAGDLLYYMSYAQNASTTPTLTTPTGWTLVHNRTPAGATPVQRVATFFKVADGSEAGASFTGGQNGDVNARQMAVIRGDVPIVTAVVGDIDSEFNNGALGASPSAQTISLVGSGVALPVAALATYHASGAVNPRGFTVSGVDAKDFEFSNTNSGVTFEYIAGKFYNAGATLTNPVVDMNDNGIDMFLTSCYIACSS